MGEVPSDQGAMKRQIAQVPPLLLTQSESTCCTNPHFSTAQVKSPCSADSAFGHAVLAAAWLQPACRSALRLFTSRPRDGSNDTGLAAHIERRLRCSVAHVATLHQPHTILSRDSDAGAECAQVAARGDIVAATALLSKYVGLYANDVEAWEELASMYLQVGGWFRTVLTTAQVKGRSQNEII